MDRREKNQKIHENKLKISKKKEFESKCCHYSLIFSPQASFFGRPRIHETNPIGIRLLETEEEKSSNGK